MALSVMNFPTPYVPQGSTDSLLEGLNSGLQLYSGLLKAFSAPQEMEMNRQEAQSKLGLTQAQTELTKAQAQKLLMPEQDRWQSDLGKTLDDYNKIKNTYGEYSPEAKQASDMINTKIEAQKAMTASRNAYAKAVPIIYSPSIVREMGVSDLIKKGGWSLSQAQQIKANPDLQANMTPEGTPGDLDRAQQLESKIQKDVIPSSIQQAQYAGARAESLLNNTDSLIDRGALDYYGLKGQALKKKDELAASVSGDVPDRLIAHRLLQGQLNAVKDEVALAMKVPADQISRGELGALFDINKYSNNKEAAQTQINNLKQLVKNQENINFTTLSKLAEEHNKINNKYNTQSKDNLQVNPDNLQKAPVNISNKLGIQKIEIPTFKDKESFHEWLKNQPMDKKRVIMDQLRNQ